jgi:DNA-binding NarL/FixJ family response regulator
MAMKFLLVDDHHLIREALRGVLKELRRDSVVLEASNGIQAMQTVAEQPTINLVLLDLTLPDRDGFTLLEELRERYPAIAVVVLSGLQDRANVVRALDLGASGYIPKSASREVMSSAIQLVLAGGWNGMPRRKALRRSPRASKSDSGVPSSASPSGRSTSLRS